MPDKILQDAENLVNYVHTLRQQGAKLLTSPQDIVPPTAGIWGSEFAEWEPEKEYKKGVQKRSTKKEYKKGVQKRSTKKESCSATRDASDM